MLIQKSFKSILLVAFQLIFIAYLMLSGRIIFFEILYLILTFIALIPAGWAIILVNTKLRITPEPAEKAKLITSGPYRFIRHPMYATVISLTFIWLIFDFTYLRLVVYLLLVINMFIKMYYEENILLNSLEGYKEYISKSKRIIPFIY
jgi:protein-S-isoprenylcysteine O-methyltransferase Ste14